LPRLHQDLVLRNPLNEGFIIVNASVLRQVQHHRQTAGHHSEAGGILMGFRRGRHLEVTFATTPKREDKRTRVAFERLSLFHRDFAIRAWRRSAHRLDYLGEWHTHPEHRPRPSAIDLAEWAKLGRASKGELLFLILGISDSWVGISGHGRVRRIQPM
jgi:integrative and conjugative element protein (TIGR02256 family)